MVAQAFKRRVFTKGNEVKYVVDADKFANWAEEDNIREGQNCCESCGVAAMQPDVRTAVFRWARKGFLAGVTKGLEINIDIHKDGDK